MQELMNSMVRFSAAMTMFGVQQLRRAAEMASDPQNAMKRLQESMDAATKALNESLDANNRPAAERMSKAGSDLVDRTMDALNVPAFDPKELVNTTTDVLRKTTGAFADLMKKASASTTATAGEATEAVGEPRPAAEALSPAQ